MANYKNMCLAANGGALSGDANEACRDNNFSAPARSLEFNVSGSGSYNCIITFPSCYIAYCKWEADGNGNAGSGSATLYITSDGVEYSVDAGSGSGGGGWSFTNGGAGTQYTNGGAGWDKVTQIRVAMAAAGSGGVGRSYMAEMQAWSPIGMFRGQINF